MPASSVRRPRRDRLRCPRRHEGDQIADVDHADRIVERVVIDNKPGMAGARKHHDEFADA